MSKRYRVQVRLINEEDRNTADDGTAEKSTLSLPEEVARAVYQDILNSYEKAHDKFYYSLV